MVSPEVLTDGSLNHNHADNANTETANTNTQVDNSRTNIRIIDGVKQPSYLNLACCISGYTTLTTYNSKQREGFRSRDISPARLSGVSPQAPDDARTPATAVFSSLCGNFLSPNPRYLTEMDHRKKSGDNVWNGNGAANKGPTSTFTSSTTSSGNSSFYHCETRKEVSSSSTYHTETVTSERQEGPTPASSFILQRVERLYGPGALAQGFYTRRSLTSSPAAQKETPEEMVNDHGKESALPVLRLLRPEFRAQLTLAKRKSSSSLWSPSRPSDATDGAVERVIPIAIEANDETNSSKIIEERETVSKSVNKDGYFYLKLVMEETGRLETLAAKLEAEVDSVPEYMEGRLRAAAGKARLLASQKLAQFKGLCHKNINQDTSEDFPTTCEDLAGFWDMVTIQVLSVHEEFGKLDALRNAGWPEQEAVESKGGKKTVSNGSGGVRRGKPATAKPSASSKARDEARKRMLAELRKTKSNTTEDIVIV